MQRTFLDQFSKAGQNLLCLNNNMLFFITFVDDVNKMCNYISKC